MPSPGLEMLPVEATGAAGYFRALERARKRQHSMTEAVDDTQKETGYSRQLEIPPRIY